LSCHNLHVETNTVSARSNRRRINAANEKEGEKGRKKKTERNEKWEEIMNEMKKER